MDYTSGSGNIGGQFTDGDPGTGTPATVVDSLWLNGVQNELVGLISDAGLTPDAMDDEQVRTALLRWTKDHNMVADAGLQLDPEEDIPSPIASPAYVTPMWQIVPSAGITITAAALTADGFAVWGNGSLGDEFFLINYDTSMKNLTLAGNGGGLASPEVVITAAARAHTLASDGSARVSMRIDPSYAWGSAPVTVTDMGGTDGEVGGVVDVSGLATRRWKISVNDQDPSQLLYSPNYTFRLEETGPFYLRINGLGLWPAHLPDDYIPTAIVSDTIRDEALYHSKYRETGHIIRHVRRYHTFVQRNSPSPWQASVIYAWIPVPPLQRDFIPPETRVTNFSANIGGTMGGNVGGVTATLQNAVVNSLSLVTGSCGVAIEMYVTHGTLDESDNDEYHAFVDFDLELWAGHTFS